MWHVEDLSINRGIQNLECAVLPIGNNKDAILDDATAKTILLSDLILVIIVFHKYVFPVLPWPQIKNKLFIFKVINVNISSYIYIYIFLFAI